ncbi:MAG: polyamine ABC transporter ATP-binding protein [Spirochaetae bacterium HGW-Spirochaetae-8]|nr:MAG: polyamine ABC transporter ATP-binding protein [Spirochaetae bacterium HGW-Spirochaetae-8]
MNNAAKPVQLKNLTKTFTTATRGEVKAVQQVNIDIQPGEFFTLLGPSGCGKTTLLRMIAGFEMPTSGQILIQDQDVSSKTPDKRDIGMVFQNYALFPHLNVFNNIAYGLKLKKVPKDEIEKRVHVALNMVQMDDFAERVPSQMSGGQQQRVALARALVMEPSVLLFDEPLSNLDAKLRIHMRDEIRRIQKKIGITTVYVTHDQSEAMAVSDKVVILKDGIVQQVDTPQRVYQHPANEFVANFIGKANILDGKIVESTETRAKVEIRGVVFDVPVYKKRAQGAEVRVVVRPESVLVGQQGFTATVTKSVYMGTTQDYRLKFEAWDVEISDNNPTSKRVYAEGEEMAFSFDPESIHVL